MRVVVDGATINAPAAQTLGELFGGVSPYLDPARLVTELRVDGAAVDPTDGTALARWRLSGGEAVEVLTETVLEFVQSRRRQAAQQLTHIADWLTIAANGLRTGATTDANTVLAAATKELAVILQLDGHLMQLDARGPAFPAVVQAIERIGERLNAAEQAQRWSEVATLLDADLVPALRADAA
jgi:hypothetical protein